MIKLDVLKNTLVSVTADNLYSLKALCESTGDYEKHKPYDFLNLTSTKKYLAELNATNNGVLNTLTHRTEQGRGGDTFVNKRLVYRYAMWVSNSFHDLVIDVFDAMLHDNQQQAESIIKIYQGHQPNHPNSLPALLNKPRSQCHGDFMALQTKHIVKSKLNPRKPQVQYFEDHAANGLIIGTHGKTLLFSDEVLNHISVQTVWM
jgi:hypothetical protein